MSVSWNLPGQIVRWPPGLGFTATAKICSVGCDGGMTLAWVFLGIEIIKQFSRHLGLTLRASLLNLLQGVLVDALLPHFSSASETIKKGIIHL